MAALSWLCPFMKACMQDQRGYSPGFSAVTVYRGHRNQIQLHESQPACRPTADAMQAANAPALNPTTTADCVLVHDCSAQWSRHMVRSTRCTQTAGPAGSLAESTADKHATCRPVHDSTMQRLQAHAHKVSQGDNGRPPTGNRGLKAPDMHGG